MIPDTGAWYLPHVNAGYLIVWAFLLYGRAMYDGTFLDWKARV